MGEYEQSGIRYVSSEIERMADDLGMSDAQKRHSLRIFCDVLESDYSPPALDDMSAACVYVGDQTFIQAVTLPDIAEVARRDMNRIRTVANNIIDELNLSVELQTAKDVLDANTDPLGIDEFGPHLKRLVDEVDDQYKGSKAPTTIAAVITDIGTDIDALDYDLNRKEIADQMNTTTVTINNRRLEVLENSNIDPPKEARTFRSYDDAIRELAKDFDVADEVFEEVETKVTEIKGSLGQSTSEAGVVLAALYVTLEDIRSRLT